MRLAGRCNCYPNPSSCPAVTLCQHSTSSTTHTTPGPHRATIPTTCLRMQTHTQQPQPHAKQVVADIVYLEVARKLLSEGLQLLNNIALLAPAVSQPPGSFISKQKLSRSALLSPAVIDAVLSYMASVFDAGDGEMMSVASPAATPLSVDRVQSARLYAGMLEFGYFAAALVSPVCVLTYNMPAAIQHACSAVEQHFVLACKGVKGVTGTRCLSFMLHSCRIDTALAFSCLSQTTAPCHAVLTTCSPTCVSALHFRSLPARPQMW